MLTGNHGVNNDNRQVTLDVTNFQDESGSVGADHHGETISKVPDPDRVSVGVKDVFTESPCLRAEGAMIG